MSKLKIVPTGSEYLIRVHDWFLHQHGRVMFEDAGYAAKTAVAEYLANQDGFTLYKAKVGLEITDDE